MRESATTVFSLLTALAVSAALAPQALAEEGYYKWVDARGNPAHSDRPPPAGIEYEFVSSETGLKRRFPAEARADDSANAQAGEADPESPGTEAPADAQQQAAVKKDPALCDQARANLDTLNSKARVRIRDDDGIRYLTEEEKAIQRQKAQDLITFHCGP